MELVLLFAVLYLTVLAVNGNKQLCASKNDCQPSSEFCYNGACINQSAVQQHKHVCCIEGVCFDCRRKKLLPIQFCIRQDQCPPGTLCDFGLCVPVNHHREKRQVPCLPSGYCPFGYQCVDGMCKMWSEKKEKTVDHREY